MQWPRAAEGNQRELAWIVTLLDRHQAQRAEHVFVDDIDDPAGRLHQTKPECVRDLLHGATSRRAVELHLTADELHRQTTDHDARIGDGRFLTSLAVLRR